MPLICTIARLSYEEVPKHTDLHTLSSLGAGGAHPNHIGRDLFDRLVVFPIEAAVKTIRIPVSLSNATKWVDFDMLYPHAFPTL